MQVSVEATGGLERRMTVALPEEKISEGVQARLQRLAQTTKVQGFRPGKVPLKVVQQRFGKEVREEVLGELIQSSFYEAVNQEKLRLAGTPTVEPKGSEAGQGLEYVATFEVMPEIKLAKLDAVTLEKPVVEISDADVDKVIETMRRQRTEWQAIDRGAEQADRVTIDFKGTIDGEEFQGNTGEDLPVILGSNIMIAGFEDGLVGAKTGADLTLDLNFPEDYRNKEVAGKAVRFAVTVKAVEQPVLPEVDEAFIKSFGIEEGTEEALRRETRNSMGQELGQKLSARIKHRVMDKLLEIHELELPQALIEDESKALLEQMSRNMQQQGVDAPSNLEPSIFETEARRRVTLGLLLSELIKQNDLKVEPAALRQQVEKIAAPYEHPEEVIKWYYGDQKRLAEVENLVLENQLVDWVLEQVKVTEVKSDFDEIMNPA